MGAGLVVVALVIVRERALTGLGGYRLPSLPAAWDNFTRGLNGTFRLLPAKRPWQPAASAFAQALPIAALVCGVLSKRGRAGLLLGATGLILAVGFDLPFVFVTKAEQHVESVEKFDVSESIIECPACKVVMSLSEAADHEHLRPEPAHADAGGTVAGAR